MKISELLENNIEHQAELEKTGFWGKQGAGCLFYCSATGRYLISHRSRYVLEPGTWGTWGGAIDSSEQPLNACKREVQEETGYHGPAEYRHLWTFKSGNFQYHNFLVTVPEEFDPTLDWENQGFAWVEYGDWPSPLHPGLKALIDSGTIKKPMTEEQTDMFKSDFATKRSTAKQTRVISSKGDVETYSLPNANSLGQQISTVKQSLQNFWNWFGDSVTVDSKNRPIVFYHGTNADIDNFKPLIPTTNTNMFGDEYSAIRAGIFMTPDRSMSNHFANRANGNVVPVYLKMENPANLIKNFGSVLDALDNTDYNTRMFNQVQYHWELFDEEYGGQHLVNALKQCGYDGVIFMDDEPVEGGKQFPSYVVFSNSQIKSAIGNKGTYSNPDSIIKEAKLSPKQLAKYNVDKISKGELTPELMKYITDNDVYSVAQIDLSRSERSAIEKTIYHFGQHNNVSCFLSSQGVIILDAKSISALPMLEMSRVLDDIVTYADEHKLPVAIRGNFMNRDQPTKINLLDTNLVRAKGFKVYQGHTKALGDAGVITLIRPNGGITEFTPLLS